MKIVSLIVLNVLTLAVFANSPYRQYLLAKASDIHISYSNKHILSQSSTVTYVIPRYTIPKGNVFCRMEDQLCRATGLWLKIGVK